MILTAAIFLATTLLGGFLFNSMGKRGIHDMSLFMAFGGAFILDVLLHLLPEALPPRRMLVCLFFSDLCSKSSWNFYQMALNTVITIRIRMADCKERPILKRIPWLAFFSLALHAILESMPVIAHDHSLMRTRTESWPST